MMRLCVVGNSHNAALVLGARDRPPSGVRFEFFQFRSAGVKPLEIRGPRGGAVVPNILILESANHVVDVEKFDAFVLCGLEFGVWPLMTIYRGFRCPGLSQPRHVQLISRECFVAAGTNLLRRSAAIDVYGKLRPLTDKPVVIVPTPMVSELVLDPAVGDNVYRECVQASDALSMAEMFSRAVAQAVTDTEVIVLRQREDTVKQFLFTRAELSLAGRCEPGPDGKHAMRDLTHMVGAYGSIVLEDIVGQLGRTL